MAYIKLFHLLFLFLWMGTLLMTTRMAALPAQHSSLQSWRRLYFLVDLPSMCLAIFTAVALMLSKHISMAQPWLHMKLTCAFLLVACDLSVGALLLKSKVLRKSLFRV